MKPSERIKQIYDEMFKEGYTVGDGRYVIAVVKYLDEVFLTKSDN
jgi:hypothetical protein